MVIVPSCAFGPCACPRGTGPGGRAPASTVAPVPARCGSSRPAASPTLSGTLRHETVRPRAPGCGRPAPRPWRHRRREAKDAGPRPSPHAADPLYAVRPTGGDRNRVDLRRAKGPPASRWSTFAEQLVLHEQLADLGVQSLVLLIPGIRRAALQPRLARGQELVTPLGGPRRRGSSPRQAESVAFSLFDAVGRSSRALSASILQPALISAPVPHGRLRSAPALQVSCGAERKLSALKTGTKQRETAGLVLPRAGPVAPS